MQNDLQEPLVLLIAVAFHESLAWARCKSIEHFCPISRQLTNVYKVVKCRVGAIDWPISGLITESINLLHEVCEDVTFGRRELGGTVSLQLNLHALINEWKNFG